jgi:predicted pyridoxine 5'-phosphate oxidase superfamily flavin-nucleotide-binding protein
MVKQLRNFALVPAAQTTPNRLAWREGGVYLEGRSTKSRIGSEEARFIAARDSFYVASLGENGPPYIQYRYGPKGFLRMLDTATLGFAVFRGSRGYISNGNAPSSWRTCLSLTDHSSLQSLKIWAETEISEDPITMEKFADSSYGATIDRIFLFHVRAIDWNWQQHTAQRSDTRQYSPRFALAVH